MNYLIFLFVLNTANVNIPCLFQNTTARASNSFNQLASRSDSGDRRQLFPSSVNMRIAHFEATGKVSFVTKPTEANSLDLLDLFQTLS